MSNTNHSEYFAANATAAVKLAKPADHIPKEELQKQFVQLVSSYYCNKAKELSELLCQQRFWWLGNNDQKKVLLYDYNNRLLWDAKPNTTQLDVEAAREKAKKTEIGGLSGWRFPSKEELINFSKDAKNPLRRGANYRLLEQYGWWTQQGPIDLDNLLLNGSGMGATIACHNLVASSEPKDSIVAFAERGWSLSPCGDDDAKDILASFIVPDLKAAYREVDYSCARLPILDTAQFTDPHKGLWEFWGLDAQWLAEQGVRARDPALDVRDCNVAIDFGTSSTVVAYDDNDRHKLLRVGIGNFWEQERVEHYENPTVLEFLDLPALLKAWQDLAYRPAVSWDHVRCSHEALQNFRANKSNSRVVASMLAKLKHWALREAMGPKLRLADRTEPQAVEHELAPLTQREPVKGRPLAVSTQDPFDPIEMYAWFLGININWRGRGLFLRYYMTFPVAYPREVKDKILASFRRGLQRSLPVTLVNQPVFDRFRVEERASEPAAYAACALQALGIAPTQEGVAYAVFDFGGGTTDFDFGVCRLPEAEEEDEGKDRVFEHFGAAGDRFLGGENLLEHLSYQVFRHNLEVCRKHHIAFTRPSDADDFAGSEMFLQPTQAASTNMVMLMARLRPLWETGTLGGDSTGMETIDLLDHESRKVSCQLAIPVDALNDYLARRIEQGVRNFLVALKQAFAGQEPEQVHVLLAGNASRSQWVLQCFGLLDGDDGALAQRLFADLPWSLRVHEPLPMVENDPFRPTAKTGVALGLLQLCPGSVTKVINRAMAYAGDEAPFAHHVGRVRQGTFQAGLLQGAVYRQWHELGVPSERVFNLYHTQFPRAAFGQVQQGESGLYKKRLDLASEVKGHKVFAQAVGPSEIEICTAVSTVAIEQGDFENMMTVALEG